MRSLHILFFFFFNDTATTEIYTLSLHDALPIYHERHPVRAGVGRLRDARDLQHDAAAGAHLRERRDRAGAVLHGGRGRRVRGQLQGQEGQVPGADGHHAAEALEPSAVMAMVTAARIRMSGTHPSSVAGTAICTKSITKSNAPTSSPSSTVCWSPRPSWASRLPVTSATAPCPAASSTAATRSLTSVWTTQDRPGL